MPRLPPPAAPRSLLAWACLLLLISLSAPAADAGPLAKERLHPDFTATSYDHIDNNGGAFLESTNGAFRAAIHNPGDQQASFYLAVLHATTGTPVWSANRDAPTGSSGRVQLTTRGLTVTDADGATVLWSATPLAPVEALRLRDDGNLQLLDAQNATLWQSFDHATDALLPGQPLPAGSYLTSARSPSDFGQGDYRLTVAASDVALTWQGSTYWRLSNDVRSFKDRNAAAASMSFNASGLFVLAADGTLVFRVVLAPAEFRMLKLGDDGRLRITSYALLNSSAPVGGDFVAPDSDCGLPLQCPSLGLCTQAGNRSSCTCPPLFAASVTAPGTCTPGDGSLLASPASCGSNGSASTPVSYLPLMAKIAYFATSLDAPTTTGVNNTACRALCTANCTCLGYFHDNSSRSCYVLGGRQLGSLHLSTLDTSALGYIKAFNSRTRASNNKNNSSSMKRSLPIILPSVAAFLLIAVVAWYLLRRMWKASKNGKKAKSKNSPGNQLNYLGHQNPRSRDTSHNEGPDEDDNIVIPGMPARFSYADITSMTASFETKIGSGGFGSVYKGELPGGEGLVAVKRLEAVGVQAKQEFCTEIAVIGSIRHVNLVRLRGFCAEGSRRLLVYDGRWRRRVLPDGGAGAPRAGEIPGPRRPEGGGACERGRRGARRAPRAVLPARGPRTAAEHGRGGARAGRQRGAAGATRRRARLPTALREGPRHAGPRHAHDRLRWMVGGVDYRRLAAQRFTEGHVIAKIAHDTTRLSSSDMALTETLQRSWHHRGIGGVAVRSRLHGMA